MFRRRPPAARSEDPQIAGFLDLTLIGAGGFSKVYTAYQERFARTVAVKVVTVDLSPEASRRFEREQQTAGQLDGHPNVIRIYESGFTSDGRPYLVMEHHAEGSLSDRLRRHGPLPVADVLEIGVKLAGALDAAHRRGIVHRDVKPQNVLLSPFVGPVLADFGIAALDPGRFTVTTEAFSVAHAAPEVLAGHPATSASDLYSLASVLYELLAGRAAFADAERPELLNLIRRVQQDPIPSIGRPDLPASAEQELVALMARDPAARPDSGAALADRLRHVQSLLGLAPTLGEGTTAPGPGTARSEPAADAHWRPPSATAPAPQPTAAARPAEAFGPADDLGPAEAAEASEPVEPSSPPGPSTPVDRPAPGAGPILAPVSAGAAEHTIVPPPRPPAELLGSVPGPPPVEDHGTVLRGRAPTAAPAPMVDQPDGRTWWPWYVGAAVVVLLLGAGVGVATRSDGGSDPVAATTSTTLLAPAAELGACPGKPHDTTYPPGTTGAAPATDLRATSARDAEDEAVVTFTDTNDGAAVYLVILHCAGTPPLEAVAQVNPGAPTEVVIEALQPGADYCVEVRTIGSVQDPNRASLATTPDGDTLACLGG